MRICFVITRGDSLGGAQIHVRDCAQFLQGRGHEVLVLVGGSGIFTDFLDAQKTLWKKIEGLSRDIHPLKDLGLAKTMAQAIGDWNPDLVSSHGSKAGFGARRACARLKQVNVFTAHGWAFTDGVPGLKSWVYKTAERFLAPLSTRIITVSQKDYDLAVRHNVGKKSQLRRVWNGLPWQAPITRTPYAPGVPLKFLSVARFQEQKDHETLLRALAPLADRDWTLELVGGGPLEATVMERARSLGLTDKVISLGERRDVPELMNRSSVFVLISHWEGLPRSIIEAMRGNLPVLASDVGGVKELIEEGVTGWTVARKDVDGLTKKFEEILDHPEKLEAMGTAGRARYEAHFTMERMMEETLKVYKEITGRDW